MKELLKLKETQRISQLERAERFIQDRIKRLEKRENTRKELISKNREKAKHVKKTLNKDLANAKKAQEKRIQQIKIKQTQERFEKCLFYSRSNSKKQEKSLTQRLDEEEETTRRNKEILKNLTTKETHLKLALQEIAMKVLNQSKPTHKTPKRPHIKE